MLCDSNRTDGSLRIVRNGIGIESKATVDWPGIVSAWTLSLHKSVIDGSTQLEHDTIVYSSVYNTCFIRLVGMDMEEFEETEMGDLESNVQSLLISNVNHDQVRVHINCYYSGIYWDIQSRLYKLLLRRYGS